MLYIENIKRESSFNLPFVIFTPFFLYFLLSYCSSFTVFHTFFVLFILPVVYIYGKGYSTVQSVDLTQ